MKTYQEIQKRQRRSEMRACAMRFRETIHPNSFKYNFSTRMKHAASALENAISYRDMSKAF